MTDPHILKKPLRIMMAIVVTLAILLSIAGPVLAGDADAASGMGESTSPAQRQGPTDPAELEAFLDELMTKDMEENHIAGAAVAVVKDGKLFFAKGYGYADLENKIPVDPEKTIFRIGSIGKTFTWTAVMQLAEQGKLDLDADVNTYLDFRIPDTYPKPITLKHLLTHTTGFDERWAGSAVSDANDVVSVREWLISHMAERVRPPGESAAYSNYNPMLAGYIIERVSGQPYGQYIQEHILAPLGMLHSSALEPMPTDLRQFASVGYAYADGAYQVSPEYIAQPALMPSGGHTASATDMARFMIAHLQDGRYSDENIPEAHILKEATAQQMHTTQYTPDPRFKGIAYGFFDYSQNGVRTIGHRGYYTPMNSLLLLLPDQRLGLFVTYNSAGGENVADPHDGFQNAFYDHYFPAQPVVDPIQPAGDFAERAGKFAGSYRQTAFPSGSFLKVAGLMNAMQAEISDSGDGALLLTYDSYYFAGDEWRFVEVDPLYFRQVDGPAAIIFREDDRGRITRMYLDPVNFTAFEKLDWYETSGFSMVLVLVCILIFLSVIPVVLIRLIRDRRLSGEQKPPARGARTAQWIILAIGILNVLILAGTVWGAMAGVTSYLLDPPLMIQISMGMAIVSAVLAIGALVYTVMAWKNSYWRIAGRIYYTLVTVAAFAFVWFLDFWNLLGWQY